MSQLLLIKGSELTEAEFHQIKHAWIREFDPPDLTKEQFANSLFFLLIEEETIFALGELIPIEPIEFAGELFDILGIGGIVANKKGRGYGKLIMQAIKDHLAAVDKTSVGFCEGRVKGFYEKCGFKVEIDLIERFIYVEREKSFRNTEDDCVLYWDGSDKFVEKVLSMPNDKLILPRPPNW